MEFLEFLFTFFSLIISIVLLPFSFLFGLIKLAIVGKNGTCWVFFEENVENVKDFSECLWHEISDFFVEGTWRTVLKFILKVLAIIVGSITAALVVGVVFVLAIMAVKYIWMSV